MNRITAEAGFSLVELMVGLALGLLVSAGVLQVFEGSKQGYRSSEALARVQEAGRFALDIMAQDLRQAGFSAAQEICGGGVSLAIEANPAENEGSLQSGRVRIALNCFAADGRLDRGLPGCANIDQLLGLFNPLGNALLGYEAPCAGGSCDWSDAPLSPTLLQMPLEGTDVITLGSLAADAETGQIGIAKHPGGSIPASATLEVEGDDEVMDQFFAAAGYGTCHSSANPAPGRCNVMVVTRACDAATLFEITSNNSNHGEINHNQGNSPAGPGNRTRILGRNYYADGGFLFGNAAAYGATTYYVARGASGLPGLFRKNGVADEELVEGIEGLQLLYGEDRDNDDAVDGYFSADGVSDWTAVLAVRISVLAQSPQDRITPEPQVISWNGNDHFNAQGDRRLRQIFTTTVSLRNRLP
jgi:type IV pilus assembly protein PilW